MIGWVIQSIIILFVSWKDHSIKYLICMDGKRLRGQGLRTSRQARHLFSPCQWASLPLWVPLPKSPWLQLLTESSKSFCKTFFFGALSKGDSFSMWIQLHAELFQAAHMAAFDWQGSCGGEQPGGCICWLAVGALQCGELWVKEEVARLLQAKSRPGMEPILLPHICESSPCVQLVLKGTKKWYHCSLLTISDGCKSRVVYYCVASFFLGRLNTHIYSPHIKNP